MTTERKALLLAVGIVATFAAVCVAQVAWIVRHLERLP